MALASPAAQPGDQGGWHRARVPLAGRAGSRRAAATRKAAAICIVSILSLLITQGVTSNTVTDFYLRSAF